MAKRKKGKAVDVNIKVNNLKKLIKEGKKWHEKNEKAKWKHRGTGFWGFGSALAMILSYAKNSSILWAILHGIISWFYVIYRIIVDYRLFR